ncbi:MAG: hypothetical protein O3A63_00450, partial [Proteobacteria bacterium]|nr:hypothetical protein [Pseudomonadota bacterium]
MNTRTEHFALEWVSHEISATLEQAHIALEQFAREGDETQLRSCLTNLHQVHGTLIMIELPGTATLADHLERLAQAMMAGQVKNSDFANQALMQGILELPAYIEQVRRGGPDSSVPMLPLVNEIRILLNLAPRKSGGDYQAEVPEQVLRVFDAIDGVEKARKIRAAYQQLLLTILQGDRSERTIGLLGKVAKGLTRICIDTQIEVLWRAFGAFVDSLSSTQKSFSSDDLKLLRRVDSEMRDLADTGREALKHRISPVLASQLVDAASRNGVDAELLERIRT